MFRKSVRLSIAVLFLFAFTILCEAEYIVKTIYFQPTNSQDRSDWLDLDNIMKSIQNTYQDEMSRHGFHNKTFELETDKVGNLILHKVRANQNKASYLSNPASIVIEELKQKGFNDIHTVYAIVMAGIEIFVGSGVGVAVAEPWAGWFGNGNSQYSGYAISTERPERKHVESIIRHELGHTFGLSHILYHRGIHYNSGDYIMHSNIGGKGNQLTELEARWLSKVRHFNSDNPFRNNFAPQLTTFHGAVRVTDNITLKATITDPDNDGIFQVYGLVNWWVIGWDVFDGNSGVEESFLTDIPDDLLEDGKISYYFMDIHGNWMYDFPDKIYTLPKKPNKNGELTVIDFDKPNKNVDLGQDTNEEDCPDCVIDENDLDEISRGVNSKSKLTTSWAALKASG